MSTENRVTIKSLDHEGRGVAHFEGKVIFIEGALVGEEVSYNSYRKKPAFEQAQVATIFKTAPMRVTPKCKHFGVCGGCSMQHLDARAQVVLVLPSNDKIRDLTIFCLFFPLITINMN